MPLVRSRDIDICVGHATDAEQATEKVTFLIAPRRDFDGTGSLAIRRKQLPIR
jgi:hypothetical protein